MNRTSGKREAPIVATDRAVCKVVDSTSLGSTELLTGFWGKRLRQCRKETLPYLLELAEDTENIARRVTQSFRIAAGRETGEGSVCNWSDAWLYKWIEGAAAVYAQTGDPELSEKMDELVGLIADAQEPDGYLATQTARSGRQRYEDPRYHELYVMGHLLTAAVAHHRATGSRRFLDVAVRVADHVSEQFADANPRMAHFPLNPSVIMGLVELYRETGIERYVTTAATIIDMRGRHTETIGTAGDVAEFVKITGYGDLNQDRVPLREETRVVGHAVFYTYLYAGATDVYMETGDRTLLDSVARLFDDLTTRRMYVTGGCCALHKGYSVRDGHTWRADPVHEAAGADFELPNATAYNETCSQVGVFMWAWRMLLATGEARYGALMERELYNGFLPGIALDGRSWFYTNPLRRDGEESIQMSNDSLLRHVPGKEGERAGSRICCPTNVLRTVAQIGGYLFGRSAQALWVHHYTESVFEDDEFRVRVAGDYPWDGSVRVIVERAPEGESRVRLRIPDWADATRVRVNGEEQFPAPPADSYFEVSRDFQAGDRIDLEFPMDTRLVECDPRIESARNHVAVVRGPVVYCLESPDIPHGVDPLSLSIPLDARFEERRERVGGDECDDGIAEVVTLRTTMMSRRVPRRLYESIEHDVAKPVEVSLIPYFAWSNRGVSAMSVWLPIAPAGR